MIRFIKASYNDIVGMRDNYLSTIYESQELFLELIVKESEYFLIEDEKVSGYFIISRDNILVEYYLTASILRNAECIFDKIIADLKVSKVYCKSFDPILLKCCMNNRLTYKIDGLLFRDFINTSTDPMSEFLIRKAKKGDIPALLQYRDGLYESEEELSKFVSGENVLMFLLNGELIGCGYLIKIIDNRNFHDIGMWVNSAYRRRGYGERIIAYLKNYCLQNHFIPVCGCGVENVGSRKTLEKNGFFSRHTLIEFECSEK